MNVQPSAHSVRMRCGSKYALFVCQNALTKQDGGWRMDLLHQGGSDQGNSFYILGTQSVLQGGLKLYEKQGPTWLMKVQTFCRLEVFDVLVVYKKVCWHSTANLTIRNLQLRFLEKKATGCSFDLSSNCVIEPPQPDIRFTLPQWTVGQS